MGRYEEVRDRATEVMTQHKLWQMLPCRQEKWMKH